MTPTLGTLGVWRRHDEVTPGLAAELEAAGYGTLWLGASPPGELALADDVLAATESLTVATGVVNIYAAEAWPVAASYRRITERFGDRFLLGVGVGHPEGLEERYGPPYEAMQRYLDELEAAAVPPEEIVLAALGPKMLQLAAERTAGAHPYLTPPAHTARAREILGADVLLAPEQKIVLAADPARARSIGRRRVANPYLGLRNYRASLRRLGFDDTDLAGEGSDRLVDALVGHGDAATAAARLRAHLDAGADHVAVQLLPVDPADDLLPGLRALAAGLA